MNMRIGMYFNDQGFDNLDLSDPCSGNNGIGGTHYCFLMLADALKRYTKHDVFFYHYHENTFPRGVQSRKLDSLAEIQKKVEADHIDILIFRLESTREFMRCFGKILIPCIAWTHNPVHADDLKWFNETNCIKRVVFVGREQYDNHIDHPVIEKSTFIYNMFNGSRFSVREIPHEPAVTYTGSLTASKGFHLLAKVWKGILNKVPEAQLYVIGSGNLYNRNSTLGKLGIASKEYEARFFPYLSADGKLLPSVHFMGTMGSEKLAIYNKTTVGVMNPSGKTETFGLSAVEMEACGIPVVTKATNGLFDTSINEKTGFLVHNERELKDRIVFLLTHLSENNQMGKNAKEFIRRFEPEVIIKEWDQLFTDIKNGKPAEYIKPTEHFSNNIKWLRVFNRNLQQHHLHTPSIIQMEMAVHRLMLRLRGIE